jgi:hypothetical protein
LFQGEVAAIVNDIDSNNGVLALPQSIRGAEAYRSGISGYQHLHETPFVFVTGGIGS